MNSTQNTENISEATRDAIDILKGWDARELLIFDGNRTHDPTPVQPYIHDDFLHPPVSESHAAWNRAIKAMNDLGAMILLTFLYRVVRKIAELPWDDGKERLKSIVDEAWDYQIEKDRVRAEASIARAKRDQNQPSR